MTAAEVILLKLAGLPLYDALIHSFSTAAPAASPTANPQRGRLRKPLIEVIIAVFALLFSVNFALYFLVINRHIKEALKSDELRFFLGVVAGATALITINLVPYYGSILESLRYSFFQVAPSFPPPASPPRTSPCGPSSPSAF